MTSLGRLRNHIGGAHRDGTGAAFVTINPTTGEPLAEVSAASPAEVDDAVKAAAVAQAAWIARPPAERARVLHRVSERLRDKRMELARIEVLDAGKPIQEVPEADIDSAADCFEFFAGVLQGAYGEHIDLGPDAFAYTRRQPLGVVGGIGAWNYPIQIASWKTAPALAAGNAMVFKPSELTPVSALALSEIIEEAGAPPGLMNVVLGGREVGSALATHPGIAKISLTGSVPTGAKVMEAAAGTLKHVTMELGGKSPLIVFDDADIDDAVSAAMLGNFYTQGEICSNATRVFVQRGVHNAFLDRAVRRTEAIRVGDPLDAQTQMGPMISGDHLAKVLSYVEAGKAEGARLMTGGERIVEGPLARGYFMRPAIFADCTDDMRIVGEEIFGPVMSVLTFDSEDEAVARANATPYGLAAGVMTRDLPRAHRMAAALQAGVVWLNAYNLTPVAMPFGGTKMSGIGRENGLAALDFYSERKSVYVNLGGVEAPY
ncbi:betaine-aldehyde dehydrogenase [Microbaculum marinum]|uniref:Betaine-aldehyde dehydrogenase n=1 Tax=Microbaculum marinum TaxID=1764581 RepID=A0AAW9RVL3_9HYPH